MKKILLGTSALIGAALLAGAASAEDPKVTVGGFSTFEAGWTKSDFDQNERDRAFRNDNEIHFNIAGKTDGGLGYGAEIDLQADIDGDFKYFADANNNRLATAFTNGPAGTLHGGGATNSYITAPRLPVEHGPSNGFSTDLWGNDDKITYYTPRFSGFQLGVSYAPSLTNRGELTNRYESSSEGSTGDIWEGGINYENQFDQIGVAAALTGETGHTKTTLGSPTVNDLRAWNAGAKVSFMGFSLAGSYGDWRDSLDVNGTKATYWTAGGSYETGPFGASVTYLSSEDKAPISPTVGQNNKFQDVSVGVDYKLAPGLTPFIEYTWYDIDPSGTAGASTGFENKGNVVIVGSELSF